MMNRLFALILIACGFLAGNALIAQETPGAADLEKAFDKKISASTVRDLDQVADLCQSAIDKGLSEEGKTQALELQVSAWLEYAEQMEQEIFRPEPSTRWRFLRQQALQRLQKVVERKPDSLAAHLLIARLNALENGDRAAAMKAVEKAIELAANDSDKLVRALMVRVALAESNDARLDDLNQALKISPDNLDALRLRAMIYLQTEQTDKAMEDFQRWSELEPDSLEPYMARIQVLSRLERFDEVLEVLGQAISKQPESANLLSLRARIYLDMTRGKDETESKELMDKALADANSALKLEAKDLEALIVRATIQSDRKEFTLALQDIEEVLKLEPKLIQGLWIRSLINAASKNYKKAIEDVETLVDGAPGNDAFQLQLAALLNADEQPRKAIAIYEKILRVDPENAQALRGRGDAYLSLGEHKLAVKDYDEALSFEPEDDGLLNNLAWVLATSPDDSVRDGKRAVELANKACELSKFSQPHILSTLASAYAEQGDFESAIKWVKDGIEKSDDPDQQSNLGKELKSYEEKKPWRELQNVEKDEENKDSNPSATEKKNEDQNPQNDSKDDKKDGT